VILAGRLGRLGGQVMVCKMYEHPRNIQAATRQGAVLQLELHQGKSVITYMVIWLMEVT